jgi:hypothetical protein
MQQAAAAMQQQRSSTVALEEQLECAQQQNEQLVVSWQHSNYRYSCVCHAVDFQRCLRVAVDLYTGGWQQVDWHACSASDVTVRNIVLPPRKAT